MSDSTFIRAQLSIISHGAVNQIQEISNLTLYTSFPIGNLIQPICIHHRYVYIQTMLPYNVYKFSTSMPQIPQVYNQSDMIGTSNQ